MDLKDVAPQNQNDVLRLTLTGNNNNTNRSEPFTAQQNVVCSLVIKHNYNSFLCNSYTMSKLSILSK